MRKYILDRADRVAESPDGASLMDCIILTAAILCVTLRLAILSLIRPRPMDRFPKDEPWGIKLGS